MANTTKKSPILLYKYMWINPEVSKIDPNYHQEIFTKNLLYLPTVKELNDPFDSIPVLSTVGCNKDELIDITCAVNSKLNIPANVIAENRRKLESDRMGVFDFIKSNYQNRHKENIRKHRVLCFSESPDNPLMWAHYAMNYSGFCLEFQFDREMFNEVLMPIIYGPQRPSFTPRDLLDPKFDYLLCFFTKSELWAYEKEWRMFGHWRLLRGNTKWKFKQDHLKAVIFGNNMNLKAKNLLKSWVGEFQGNIQLKSIEFDDDDYRLKVVTN